MVPAYVTRVGVFEYRDGAGKITRELRLPEEVFAPASLASLQHAPVTDLHPPEMVNAENWRQYSVGSVGRPPKADGIYVDTGLVINDADEIILINKGDRKEASCAYTCDNEIGGGYHPEYGRYDTIQRNIRYNHVGLGPSNWGRAGSNVGLRLDSTSAIQQPQPKPKPEPQPKPKPKAMPTLQLTVDGITFLVQGDDAALQAVTKLKKDCDAWRGRAQESATTNAQLKKDMADLPARLLKEAEAAQALRADAAKVLPKDFDFEPGGKPLDNKAIYTAVIQSKHPDLKLDGESDDYLRARFDSIVADGTVEYPPVIPPHVGGNPAAPGGAKGGAKGGNALATAYNKFHSDQAEAWKQPLAATKT